VGPVLWCWSCCRFDGPVNLQLPRGSDYAPWDQFYARCEWASIGCAAVRLGIANRQGAYAFGPPVPGARFALNVSLAPATGSFLLPTGSSAPPPPFVGRGEGLARVEVLLTVAARDPAALLNASRDYSYLDTPLVSQQNAPAAPGSMVYRRILNNPRVLTYVDGELAWGIPPSRTPSQVQASPRVLWFFNQQMQCFYISFYSTV
jgi:hypothetical protein